MTLRAFLDVHTSNELAELKAAIQLDQEDEERAIQEARESSKRGGES